MPIKTKTTKLKDCDDDEVTVETITLPGSTGISLFWKILEIISPLISFFSNPEDIVNQDVSKITDALFKSGSLKVDKLISELLQGTIITDSTGTRFDLSNVSSIDFVFSGNYGLLLNTVKFVLEVNYSSFLGKSGIKGMIPMISKIIKK